MAGAGLDLQEKRKNSGQKWKCILSFFSVSASWLYVEETVKETIKHEGGEKASWCDNLM